MTDYRCYYCKETKPETKFYLAKRKHRPVSDFCKPCKRAMDKARYEGNKEARKEQSAEWAKNNRAQANASVRNSRIVTTHGNVIVHNNIRLDVLQERDKDICGLCDLHVDNEDASRDHKTPLSRGGLHSWNNVHLAHKTCNAQKGDKTLEEWNKLKGRS